jgi:hypothetical protein
VALSQHQARAVASAPKPSQDFELGEFITRWFQQYGQGGLLALVALALVWGALTQAQNMESAIRLLRSASRLLMPLLMRLLGRDRPQKESDPVPSAVPPTPTSRTPHNLPQASDSSVPLLGRDAALARLTQLLETGTAPVWITGMDGVGKTALALHHLRQRLDDYGGGVVLLDGQRSLAGLVEELEQFALVHFDQQVPEDLPPVGRLAWLYSHWPLPGPVVLFLDEVRDPADLQAMGRGLPERFRLLVSGDSYVDGDVDLQVMP